MLAIQDAAEPLERPLNLRAPLQPRAMHAVAGTINITSPDAFKAHQHIAIRARRQLFDFIRKRSRSSPVEAGNRAETPLVRRPVGRSVKADLMTLLHPPGGEPFQI